NSLVATLPTSYGTLNCWNIVLLPTVSESLSHPLKYPLNNLKALNRLKLRRQKLKKIPARTRTLRTMRALRGKIRGPVGVINQRKKPSKDGRCAKMTSADLVADLQRQGFILTPLPEGKLAVKPVEKLTGSLREALRQRKAEVLALLQQQEPSASPDYRTLYQ